MNIEFKERKFYTSKLKPILPMVVFFVIYIILENFIMTEFSMVAYASFFFICIAFILFLSDFFRTLPKLIINDKGMLFLSYKNMDIFVPWADIEKLKCTHFFFHKKLHVIVSNPQDYINKFQGFRKTILFRKLRHYHTPIEINFSHLKCRSASFQNVVQSYFKHYKPLLKTDNIKEP